MHIAVDILGVAIQTLLLILLIALPLIVASTILFPFWEKDIDFDKIKERLEPSYSQDFR